ncbi:hypothetical protein EVAR_80814_1 [Eumeta japonica]|uniref:RNA-directed DNA polymerase from mobile element jockey n=1 Tax=Eumeta variegata TaxID=151549 RepID=A0A4C1WCM1_EUMVA|nr:hypothetical protein EVAR_80814_1 [Eumeta japonica]
MPDKLRLRGQAVEWNTRVRYLGVHIDRSLRMTPQINHVIQTSRAACAKLRPILASRLPIRTNVAIYKCYVRSRLTYAARLGMPFAQDCSASFSRPSKT